MYRLSNSFAAFSASLLLTLAIPACAAPNLVDVTVVDREMGGTLPAYRYRSQTFVEGQPGSRYAIQLNNRSNQRVMVVLSVDGVNVITGETATVNQSGYVLAPYARTEITGWRKNLNEAAAFYFTALPDSYAARTDRPDNVGVIGAAVFTERPTRPISPPPVAASPERGRMASKAEAGAAAPSADLREADRLGTGHGEREYSPTRYTDFERASHQPNQVVRLRYDSYANLVAMGVIPSRRAPQPFTPDPFPGFTPDPR
ncbi:hypothetical protein [Chitinivorax sp. B]|uniref:hypothetical protein n=1 Tax=Chitinivorax sp. B TaxID=2502235 RepID=UPI002016C312|nr:hypothetical protein [Chitinivorax sp. B]